MQAAEFDFELPENLIAQAPANQRHDSRLLVLNRNEGTLTHRQFVNFPDYLNRGDVLILNDSRVIKARLFGSDLRFPRRFEILLVEENSTNDWWVMMKPAKKAPVGTEIRITDKLGRPSDLVLIVKATNAEGHRRVFFSGTSNVLRDLEELGNVPLPPYISRHDKVVFQDEERYQTIFANREGSVAAPTAGLHFTSTVLDAIRSRGVNVCFLTLHVGVGTFAPVKTTNISAHHMHAERYEINDSTLRTIAEAKSDGRRIVAVGTTTVRVLESLASCHQGIFDFKLRTSAAPVRSTYTGRTKIFIYPPFDFEIVDVLLTNFHLPRSTLLMLVSAFASPGSTKGRRLVLDAYTEAVREKYRFFSYGDAMLLL